MTYVKGGTGWRPLGGVGEGVGGKKSWNRESGDGIMSCWHDTITLHVSTEELHNLSYNSLYLCSFCGPHPHFSKSVQYEVIVRLNWGDPSSRVAWSYLFWVSCLHEASGLGGGRPLPTKALGRSWIFKATSMCVTCHLIGRCNRHQNPCQCNAILRIYVGEILLVSMFSFTACHIPQVVGNSTRASLLASSSCRFHGTVYDRLSPGWGCGVVLLWQGKIQVQAVHSHHT